MAATIKIKNSSTTGAVPTSSDLVQGELAVNVTDLGLYTENASGTVVKLNAPSIDDKGTGATKRLTIDTSGNLGLGVTPSAWTTIKALQVVNASFGGLGNGNYSASNAYYDGSNWKYIASNYATLYQQSGNAGDGTHKWNIAASGTAGNAISFTQAMTLDASGNLLVGATSAAAGKMVVKDTASSNTLWLVGRTSDGASSVSFRNAADSAYNARLEAVSGYLAIETNGSERARIDSSGNLLVGTTSTTQSHTFIGKLQNAWSFILSSPFSTQNFGMVISYTAQAPNSTGNWFYYATDTVGQKFGVASNGGVYNYTANNVNLSDRREKTNFAPAGDYLDKICAIPVQTYNYIDQNMEEDGGLTLGVVAQDVQAVAPELVSESNWAGKDEEPKMRLGIYQTDLQYALMKSIQELKAIVDAQAVEIAALKGQA